MLWPMCAGRIDGVGEQDQGVSGMDERGKAWSRYWSSGRLHSCTGSYAGTALEVVCVHRERGMIFGVFIVLSFRSHFAH